MTLQCQHFRPLLDSYLTDELQVETLQAVNAHLAECAGCRAALASREHTRAALNSAVRGLTADAAFADLIRGSVRAEARRPRVFRLPWVAIAAAVVLSLAAVWQYRADSTRILAILGLAKGDHVFCARGGFFPDELPTPAEMRAQVGPAYAPLVDQLILHTSGYVIREGHLCHWQDREFVHFIIEKQNKLISVILTTKKADETFPRHALLAAMRTGGFPVYTTEDNGMAIASLDTGGHVAFVVSERGPREGLTLLAALAPSLPR